MASKRSKFITEWIVIGLVKKTEKEGSHVHENTVHKKTEAMMAVGSNGKRKKIEFTYSIKPVHMGRWEKEMSDYLLEIVHI